jgi:hypothetical protein
LGAMGAMVVEMQDNMEEQLLLPIQKAHFLLCFEKL